MSVLTDVLKRKDKALDDIPETETPSEADLDEVGPVAQNDSGATDSEPRFHELSVDEGDPTIVEEAIAELEASDPNETANVAPSLVLEDTMETSADDLASATMATSLPNVMRPEEPDDQPDTVRPDPIENKPGVTTVKLSSDKQRIFALAGGLLVGIFLVAGYLVYQSLQSDTSLTPANFAVTPDTASTVLSETPLDQDQSVATAETELPTAAPSNDPSPAPTSMRSSEPLFAPVEDMQFEQQPTEQVQPIDQRGAVAVSSGIQINRQRVDDPVFLGLSRAYDAYLAGDTESAASYYRDVVALEPTNRDALLGLASLAQSDGRIEEAGFYFESLLELDPKDGVAAAGLMSLQQRTDTVADESALKTMLREQPEAAHLHFTLGMRYVAQGRWPDAQTAFFDAVRFAPQHPDYSFNLAVSLDRMGKTGSAAIYYARALDNANGRQGFDIAQARARLDELNGG